MLAQFGGPAAVWSMVMWGERCAELAPPSQFGRGAQPCPEQLAFGLLPGAGDSAGVAGERCAGQMWVITSC